MKQKKDQIVFFNIPSKYRAGFRHSILHGLFLIRSAVGEGPRVQILLYYDPSEDYEPTGGVVSDGRVLDRHSIVISYNIKRYQRLSHRHWNRELTSTIVHEYVHCLRYKLGPVKTYLDKIVEEGVACYFQCLLAQPPEYLDLGRTSVNNAAQWWRWWHKKYLSKPIGSLPAFETDAAARQGFYRIAYHLVTGYVSAYPSVSGKRVLLLPRKTTLAFARRLFSYRRTKIKSSRK